MNQFIRFFLLKSWALPWSNFIHLFVYSVIPILNSFRSTTNSNPPIRPVYHLRLMCPFKENESEPVENQSLKNLFLIGVRIFQK